jgi:hypothetical protein
MIPNDFSGKSQKWIEMGDINLPIGDLLLGVPHCSFSFNDFFCVFFLNP